VASTITNAELVSGLASFSSTDLQLGGVGSGVPRGKITRSNDLVSFRVVVTGLGYRKVADFDYKITAASASRGVPRGRGMAFVLPEVWKFFCDGFPILKDAHRASSRACLGT
jgi:hypothetical protein